jgi:hypothetical protein
MHVFHGTLLVLCTFVFSELNAQDANSPDPNFTFLMDQSVLDVEFDFSDFRVGWFKNEPEYVEASVETAERKNSGDGRLWMETWNSAKKSMYPMYFMKGFNERLAPRGIHLDSLANAADFVLIVKVIRIDPRVVIKKDALVSPVLASVTVKLSFYDREMAEVIYEEILPFEGAAQPYHYNKMLAGEVIGISGAFQIAGDGFGKKVARKLRKKKH